jgi:hypothetical protein
MEVQQCPVRTLHKRLRILVHQQRMDNWRQAAKQAAPLGEEFLELMASGRIKAVTERLN